ncbi:MAG: glycosyltransferase family 4 protein [Lachnospiraceae bacterium]|nr:glycosyltransferase family 4 protein [Lachnospiraceae bacterium]
MNIIYITLSEPRLSENGIYPDLVRALKNASHNITIVYAASPRTQKKTELVNEDGVDILKVVVGENFDVSLLKKGINTLRMEPVLKRAIKKHLKNRSYDLCIYATPPVTFAGVVMYCKNHFGLKTFLMLKDIFPQNAVDIGLFKEGSFIHCYFRAKEKMLYTISDRIGCMSEGNVEYIKAHEPWIDESRLLVFPNTIAVPSDPPVLSSETSPKEGEKKIRFVFGGNLGKPQAIDWLIKAISDKKLLKRKDIEFHIIGQGSEKETVKKASERSGNLFYTEQLSPSEYDKLMSEMDVGIISLDHRFTIPNYPSRILSYMKAAKPVLACTDETTDIRKLVETDGRFGLWVSSDDKEGFAEAVLKLSSDGELRKEMGLRGYHYLKEHFNVDLSVRLLESLVQ